MCHAILQSFFFPEEQFRSKLTCFYLIHKKKKTTTASALENAVNKVTLVYLALLAKIGYLFTRGNSFLFVLLSIGCVSQPLLE